MTDLVDLFGGHFMSPVADPYPVYAALRRSDPVTLVDLPMGPGYIVTRYDDVYAILSDAARFSSRANAKGIGLLMGRTILEMDGTAHRRHRNIIAPAFVPKALTGDLPAVVGAMAERLLDAFVGHGEADLVAQLAKTFPLRVIAHIIGIPIADFDAFEEWASAIIGFTDDPPRGFAAAEALVSFLRPIMDQRKAEPKSDLMSVLVHAAVDGEHLSDEEVFSFLRLLLPAGAETTYRLIGNTLFALLTNPEQLEAVRADRTLLDHAIEESLRWEAPVQYAAREANERVVLSNVEVPAGAQLLIALGSANRDERQYDQPDRFDLNRVASDHLAFGFGPHFCAGAHLARLEAQIAIDAILDRLPNLRLERSQPCGVVGLAFRSPDRLPVRWDGRRDS